MILGFDAREIQSKNLSEVGISLLNMIKCLDKHPEGHRIILFTQKPLDIVFKQVQNVVLEGGGPFTWEQMQLPAAIKKAEIEIFYSPSKKIPFKAKCKKVSTIPDLINFVYSDYEEKIKGFERFSLNYFGQRFINKSDAVLTVSESSKKDITNYYRVDSSKIHVMGLSVDPIFKPEKDDKKISLLKEKFGIKNRYLLYMGNFMPHKDVNTIVKAFKILSERYNDLDLVLAGPRTHEFREIFIMVDQLNLNDRIIFTGKIHADDEPHILYSGASAFLSASLLEGFGMPVLESMACGCPVVATRAGAVADMIGDAGVLIETTYDQQMAEAVENILNDPQLRDNYRQKGLQRAQLFSPQTITGQMLQFFQTLLD